MSRFGQVSEDFESKIESEHFESNYFLASTHWYNTDRLPEIWSKKTKYKHKTKKRENT